MRKRRINVYLSGATKKVDGSFQNWRAKCLSLGDEDYGWYHDLNFINPISFFNYTEKKPKTEKQCLDLFMWQIDQSDLLLVNLDYSEQSPGTLAEIEHAYCRGIPVIGFGEKPKTWYNWAEERCSVVFDELEEAVQYINDAYGSIR